MAYTPEERKEAQRVARKKWHDKNVDRVNARRRQHRAEDPRVRERGQQYYLKNKDRIDAANKQWREENPDFFAANYQANRKQRIFNAREWTLKRRFGLSLKDYDDMLLAQNGVCAICGGRDKNRRLAVDHCHHTGRVRGLLCRDCNVSLGLMREDCSRLSAAISYLQENR